MVLTTILQGLVLKEFLPGVLQSLWYFHVFEMELLIALSTSALYICSVVSYACRISYRDCDTDIHFATCVIPITAILFGRVGRPAIIRDVS